MLVRTGDRTTTSSRSYGSELVPVSMVQGSHPGTPSAGLSPVEVLRQVWSQKLVFLVVMGLLSAAVIGSVSLMKDIFSSDGLLMVRLNSVDFSNLPGVIGSSPSGEGLNLVHSEVEILSSEAIARQVVQQLDLSNVPGFIPGPSFLSHLRASVFGQQHQIDPATAARDRTAAAIGQYMKGFSVYNDGKSYIIQVGFSGADGALAQKILNTHIATYLADQDAAKQAILGRAQHWLDGQLGGLETQVATSERDLQSYSAAHHLGRTGGDTVGTHELSNITTQLATAQSDLARKQAYLEALNGLSRQPSAEISNSTVLGSGTIERLREQEGVKAAEVASLEQQFGNNNPIILNARGALEGTRAAIRAEVARMHGAAQSDVGLARANVAALSQSLQQAENQVGGEEDAGVMLAEKQRKLDAARTLYADLLSRSKQVAIQRETQETNVYVVSPPTLPLQASAPRRGLLMALGLCVDAVIAAVAAFGIGTLRSQSTSLETIEYKCDIAGVGTVPEARRGLRRSMLPIGDIMAPMSKFASAIQTLGNSLLHSPIFANPQVIAIASPTSGDGKTLLAACLGRSFAMTGRRVLLIDGDFRKPELARMLAVPTYTGIFDVLEKQLALDAAVKRVDNLALDVLPVEKDVGPFFSHMGADKLDSLIDQARANYDIVLIDTSSMAIVDDSLALIRMADVTVCVARRGVTRHHDIVSMTRRLRSFEIPCAGIILNGVKASRLRLPYWLRSARTSSSRRYFQG